jgi:hypothetical protein
MLIGITSALPGWECDITNGDLEEAPVGTISAILSEETGGGFYGSVKFGNWGGLLKPAKYERFPPTLCGRRRN